MILIFSILNYANIRYDIGLKAGGRMMLLPENVQQFEKLYGKEDVIFNEDYSNEKQMKWVLDCLKPIHGNLVTPQIQELKEVMGDRENG